MARRLPQFPSLLVLLSLLLFVATACGCASPKRASGSAMSPGYYEEQGYAGGAHGGELDESYDYEEDMVEAESVSISSRSRSGGERAKRSSKRDAPAMAPMEPADEMGDDMAEGEAMEAPMAEPMAEPMDGSELAPPDDMNASERPQPTASKKRQVIYTAMLQVSVYDLPGALAFAESLPSRHGGWLQQRQDNRFVLRVPVEQLEEVMKLVAELGVVELRTLEGLDVTNQYTDLDSRIRVLEQMQAHLQALLAQAKTVEQTLEVRRVLDAVTLELESARAQMRSLAQSIAFSTLILTFTERGPAQDLPESNDPFSWVDRLGAEATEWR